MAELTQITGGVLEQDIGAVGFTTPGGLAVNTRWTDLGIVPRSDTFNGLRLNNDSTPNVRRFRASAVSGNDNNAITAAFGFATNSAQAVLDPDRFFVMTERGSGGTPIRSLLVQVLNFRDASTGGTRILEIVVDIDPSGDAYIAQPGASSSNYSFAFENFGDVTSTQNMNFDGDITLRAFPNIPLLGTDSNGRLVRGIAGSVTEGATLPTAPDMGDIHKLTAPQIIPGATVQGFVPVTATDGTLITLSRYGTGTNVHIEAGVFINFQINGNRNTTVPLLTGTNGNNPQLAFASGFINATTYLSATAEAQSDPTNWTELTGVLNSTPNGNTSRIRVEALLNGTTANAQAAWRSASAGQVLGFITQVPGPTRTVQPSTYFWNGTLWIELVDQLPDGTGDTGSDTGDNYIGIIDQVIRRTPLSTNIVTREIGGIFTDFTGTVRQMDWVVGQRGFIYEVVTPTATDTGPADFGFPATGAVAGFIVISADAGNGSISIDVDTFIRQAPTSAPFPDSIPSDPAGTNDDLTLVITPFNPLDADTGSGLTVEGNDGNVNNMRFNDTTLVDFNHSDFLVTQIAGTTDGVLISARSDTGDGIITQDNGTAEVNATTLFNFMNGLVVTPDDPDATNASSARIDFNYPITNVSSTGSTTPITGTTDLRIQDPLSVVTGPGIRTLTLGTTVPRMHTHSQTTADTSWIVDHGLNSFNPVITVYDSTNEVVLPMSIIASTFTNPVTMAVENRITIEFPFAVAGTATLIG